MDFDLRQLRHARALAEQGSFVRAARTLHLSQPALSRSIQELERRTGVKLFERLRGRVEPTNLGRVFLAHARELLVRADTLDREVATLRGTGTGGLVIGSGTFPTAIFMGDALTVFLRRNPGVAIRVVNDHWVNLVAALRRREIDVVVAAPPLPAEAADLSIRHLARRQGYFVVRPGHPLAARTRVTLADVTAYPIVTSAVVPASGIDALLEVRLARESRRSMPDVGCESHELMCEIAASTDHVMLSAVQAVERWLNDGRLVALPLVDLRIASLFSVITLDSRTLPRVAHEFINDVVAADQAAEDEERQLIAGLFKPIVTPVRRRLAAVRTR